MHGHPGDHLDDGPADGGRMFAATVGRHPPTPLHVAGEVAEIRYPRALDIDIAQLWQLPRASVEQLDHGTLARQQIEQLADHGGDLRVDIARGGPPQGSLQDRPVYALTERVVEESGGRIHPAGALRQRGEIDVATDIHPGRRGLQRELEKCLLAVGVEIESADRETCLPGNVDDLRGTESVAGEDFERRGRDRGQPCRLLASQFGLRVLK
jgi:hypothetical protein